MHGGGGGWGGEGVNLCSQKVFPKQTIKGPPPRAQHSFAKDEDFLGKGSHVQISTSRRREPFVFGVPPRLMRTARYGRKAGLLSISVKKKKKKELDPND